MAENKYKTKELVSFGNYLLSKRRKKRISKINRHYVTDADVANWKVNEQE